jgi:hypothetical protein
MIGRQFTSGNNLSDPTHEKLDRVLMDTNWEYHFHMGGTDLECIVGLSDHAPILFRTGSPKP